MNKSNTEMLTVGKNNLMAPVNLYENAIHLGCRTETSVAITMPFNKLYSLWKPSHFYTGLEIHSHEFSWRTFRLHDNTITGLKMHVRGNELIAEVYSKEPLTADQIENVQRILKRSYGTDEPLNIPKSIIDANQHVKELFPSFKGTRISCPENLFEISVVSLLLQNTNISRTTSMFSNLVRYYGKLVLFDGIALFAFFAPSDFSSATESELKEKCRLGYRAKYILNYADFFQLHKDNELRTLEREELLSMLKTIKGVGPYTSNIVASSALRDKTAIPFDSWNRKILAEKLYSSDPNDLADLHSRIVNDFGEYAGLISMYVIENEYKDNPVVPLMEYEEL